MDEEILVYAEYYYIGHKGWVLTTYEDMNDRWKDEEKLKKQHIDWHPTVYLY